MNTDKLIRVSTYAKNEDISVQTVYDRIRDGKLRCIVIDGIKFIEPNEQN
jgi:predicted site-specific integrase-resolvase